MTHHSVKKIIKDVYKGSDIVNVVLLLVTFMLCVVVGMTFLLPKPDAHWIDPEGTVGVAMVSLKDTMLFAWHRNPVQVKIFDYANHNFFEIGKLGNGTHINLAGVILLVVVSVTLALAIPACIVSIICFKQWKSNQILCAMLWANTLFMIGLLANAIANQSATWMSHFTQMGLDGTKLTGDIATYMTPGTALHSVMLSYTFAGRIMISILSALLGAGGCALCFGAFQRYSKVKKIVDINTNETIIIDNNKTI